VAETDIYSHFTIKQRGPRLYAEFHLKSPNVIHDVLRDSTNDAVIVPRKQYSDLFNEKSLARQVDRLESQGKDASLWKSALTALRKAELEP
jgi:hypothetical protein